MQRRAANLFAAIWNCCSVVTSAAPPAPIPAAAGPSAATSPSAGSSGTESSIPARAAAGAPAARPPVPTGVPAALPASAARSAGVSTSTWLATRACTTATPCACRKGQCRSLWLFCYKILCVASDTGLQTVPRHEIEHSGSCLFCCFPLCKSAALASTPLQKRSDWTLRHPQILSRWKRHSGAKQLAKEAIARRAH